MPDGLLFRPICQINGISMYEFTHHHAKGREIILTIEITDEVFIFTLHTCCIAPLLFKTFEGRREASPRQLNISLISSLKMASPGQVKDNLNWSFKSNIFAHTLRVPFPVM